VVFGVLPRPITGEAVFEGLWFADSFKLLSLGLFDELVDAVKNLLVGFLPVLSVFPGVVGKDELHSRSSFSFPPPCSSSITLQCSPY
tara:strand:- start:169 stop:429 length:261 start_codon:yes stop_codon:yes gene_type:complete